MRPVFITGTDTEIGKTVVSAIVTEALDAHYWKPVQCGELDHSDSMKVAGLVRNGQGRTLPEAFCLQAPMSPHAAADLENVRIDPAAINLPEAPEIDRLVIEGAGGLLVPLNHEDLYLDWVVSRDLPVILVSGNRLGSINHTLLSVEALRSRGADLRGIIFNGDPAPTSESVILKQTGLKAIGFVPRADTVDAEFVLEQASALRPSLLEQLP